MWIYTNTFYINMIYYKYMFNTIKHFFTGPNVEPEALKAYFYRLPDKISINWFRDGDFIIGKIKAGDAEFMTQAKSADEFVEMINDTLFTVYEIPREYSDLLLRYKRFEPNPNQFNELEDASIKKSSISFAKQKLEPNPA